MSDKKEIEAVKRIDEVKGRSEMLQVIEAITALQVQRANPTRAGMIEALRNAQSLASTEIQGEICQNGGLVCSKPWIEFTANELYALLSTYQNGLIQHGKKKCHDELFKKFLSERGL